MRVRVLCLLCACACVVFVCVRLSFSLFLAGQFGMVYRATAWGTTPVAAKKLKQGEQQEFMAEVEVLMYERHRVSMRESVRVAAEVCACALVWVGLGVSPGSLTPLPPFPQEAEAPQLCTVIGRARERTA